MADNQHTEREEIGGEQLLEMFRLRENADAFEIANEAIEKIFKRIEANWWIQDIFQNKPNGYALGLYFQQLNIAIQEEAVAQDKGEIIIEEREAKQHTWDDGEEVPPAPIDTYAASFLAVQKREVPVKGQLIGDTPRIFVGGGPRGLRSLVFTIISQDDEADDMRSHTSKVRKPMSRVHSNMTVRKHTIGDKASEGTVVDEEYKQVPLPREPEDGDLEIEIYRKQKQRDFDRREEERKKQEAMKRKLNEAAKERRAYEEELNKKTYTFDTNGDVIVIKSVNTEQLPKEAVNYELKYNLKKMPLSIKGAYNFEKAPKLSVPLTKKRDGGSSQISLDEAMQENQSQNVTQSNFNPGQSQQNQISFTIFK